ncbi:MAG: peptidoglycan-binding domain-containing protein, partial [Patescibacteria group bacterium]
PSPAPTPSPSLTASPEATLTPSPAQSAQVSPVPSTTPASLFTKNLYFGLTDREVRILQQSLNNIGFKISTGWGSPGYETEFFGPKTYQSVLTFQKTYNIPQTGYFGPLSRAKMNELIK